MAAAKRSRRCRTPSSGDITMLTSSSNDIFSPVSHPIRLVAPSLPPPALAVARAVRKPSPMKNRPPIFTICSSSFEDSVGERSDEGDSKKFGGFLEKCCFCRKVIDEGKAVFMYRSLQAYCTAECREKQIRIDKNLEKLAAKPKQKCTGKRAGFFYAR